MRLRATRLMAIASAARAALRPSFAVDFLALSPGDPMPAGITFSRASPATQFDALGWLVWAPSQLFAATNDLANSTIWTRLGGVAPDVTGGQADPLGGNTAFLLDVSPAADSRIAQDLSGAKTPLGGNMVFSAWMRTAPGDPDGTYAIRFRRRDATTITVLADLTAAWTRVSMPFAILSGASSVVAWIGIRDASASLQRCLMWRPMIGPGTTVYPYIENASASGASFVHYPRFDYDPATLQPAGLRVEEARTNSIRNSMVVGGVAGVLGAGGALPTNWTATAVAGVTVSVSYGTEAGMPYLDIAYSGTNTSGVTAFPTIAFEAPGNVAAANGQAWTHSVYWRKVAGEDALTTWGTNVAGRDSGGSLVSGQVFVVAPNDNGTLPSSRATATFTFSSASVAAVQSRINRSLNAGASIDITMRIACPQLEQGAFATSFIPTYGTAFQRTVEAPIASTAGWFNPAEGTVYAETQAGGATVPTATYGAAYISDGGTNNRVGLAGSGGNVFYLTNSGGVSFAAPADGAVGPTTTLRKSATSYSANRRAGVTNNRPVLSATGAMPAPTGVTTMNLGGYPGGSNNLNGLIRRVSYYPFALTDSQLQALTA